MNDARSFSVGAVGVLFSTQLNSPSRFDVDY